MPRKHYSAMASVYATLCAIDNEELANAKQSNNQTWEKQVMVRINRTYNLACAYATLAQNDNPRFDRAKFMKACGF